MDILDIIVKKRDGSSLSEEEINYFINNVVEKKIPDYQVSALLMAITLNGMNDDETYYLTKAMLNSGQSLDLSSINGIKVDKHSTGGVGDKTSLVVMPILASLGLKCAKMSGRGLSFTGGTLDKLESIPGFRTNLTEEEFINQVSNIGIALVGQTRSLVPADKILYALRDVTGTVSSIPLITSSILSKKLALSSDVITIDVKTGSGAFMSNLGDALSLKLSLEKTGERFGKKVKCIISNMDEPLGKAVGNILEIKEAIDTLNGQGMADFKNLCLSLAAETIYNAGLAPDIVHGINIASVTLKNGQAFKKFVDMVQAQGGDICYIKNPTLFENAKYKIPYEAKIDAYINHIDAKKIGLASMLLGAGRRTLKDKIDYTAGITFERKKNDFVRKGEVILYLYTNKENVDDVISLIDDAIIYGDNEIEDKLIYE
jgi:pyrimidine-nucleoside phosphorylase